MESYEQLSLCSLRCLDNCRLQPRYSSLTLSMLSTQNAINANGIGASNMFMIDSFIIVLFTALIECKQAAQLSVAIL